MAVGFEIEVNTGVCTNCKGLDNCSRYCVIHAGKTLADFINRVDMIETRIGEYSSREKDGPKDLIISGHQLYDLNNPSWLLTDIKTTLDASNKFNSLYDKTATQLVSLYCNKVGMTKEEINEINDKIKRLNKNKLLILPFKPHTACNIDIDLDGEKQKKKDSKIAYLKWTTNKETYKLNCEIAFEVSTSFGTSTYKIPITDYIKRFRISQMDIQAKGKSHDASLINITDAGIIKPIVIKESGKTIAVDGTYVYYTLNNDTRIIGRWNSSNKLVIDADKKIMNTKAIEKILDNESYIKNHKRYIAPYMLYQANEIIL